MNNNRQPSDGNRRPQNGNYYPAGAPRQGTAPAGRSTGGRGANSTGRPASQNSVQHGSSMSRIGNQTPDKRRTQQKRQVKLTAEQIEINKINRQREIYYIKKRRSAMLKVFMTRLWLFVVLFILLSLLCGAMLFLNLTRVESEDVSRYSYVIGDSKYTLAHSQAVRDGRVYISFTDIAEQCDLAVTGSPDDMKYIIKGDEAETIRFVTGSRIVYVNDVETRLGAECYFEDGELYVPADFVSAYFNGITVNVDKRNHKVTVERDIVNLNENGKLDKGVSPEYSQLSFLLQSAAGLDPLTEEEEKSADLPDLGFVTNLMVYEDYMNPGNSTDYLTVVSVKNKLPSDYAPQDLIAVSATRKDGRQTQMLREYAAMALEALYKEMRAAGFEDVSVTSAYRSYSYQEYLFNSYLAQHNNDYEYVSTFSNPPGSSEHQTGLCADMHNLSAADIAFGKTDAFKWLRENCWKFGFILRYPEDKTEITGISYEPWHYRYVGRYHAQRMYQMNMCLEEYVEYIGLQGQLGAE